MTAAIFPGRGYQIAGPVDQVQRVSEPLGRATSDLSPRRVDLVLVEGMAYIWDGPCPRLCPAWRRFLIQELAEVKF